MIGLSQPLLAPEKARRASLLKSVVMVPSHEHPGGLAALFGESSTQLMIEQATNLASTQPLGGPYSDLIGPTAMASAAFTPSLAASTPPQSPEPSFSISHARNRAPDVHASPSEPPRAELPADDGHFVPYYNPRAVHTWKQQAAVSDRQTAEATKPSGLFPQYHGTSRDNASAARFLTGYVAHTPCPEGIRSETLIHPPLNVPISGNHALLASPEPQVVVGVRHPSTLPKQVLTAQRAVAESPAPFAAVVHPPPTSSRDLTESSALVPAQAQGEIPTWRTSLQRASSTAHRRGVFTPYALQSQPGSMIQLGESRGAALEHPTTPFASQN